MARPCPTAPIGLILAIPAAAFLAALFSKDIDFAHRMLNVIYGAGFINILTYGKWYLEIRMYESFIHIGLLAASVVVAFLLILIPVLIDVGRAVHRLIQNMVDDVQGMNEVDCTGEVEASKDQAASPGRTLSSGGRVLRPRVAPTQYY